MDKEGEFFHFANPIPESSNKNSNQPKNRPDLKSAWFWLY